MGYSLPSSSVCVGVPSLVRALEAFKVSCARPLPVGRPLTLLFLLVCLTVCQSSCDNINRLPCCGFLSSASVHLWRVQGSVLVLVFAQSVGCLLLSVGRKSVSLSVHEMHFLFQSVSQ